MIRGLSEDARVEHDGGGTEVWFRMAPVAPPVAPVRARPAVGVPAPGDAVLEISGDGGDRRIELHGDLDLAGVAAVRADLLRAVAAAVAVTLDLTGTGYVSSAGVGLLADVAERVRRTGTLRVLVPPAGRARRALGLAGLDELLCVPDAEPG